MTSEKPLAVEPIVIVMPDGSLAYTFKEVNTQDRQGGDERVNSAGTAPPQGEWTSIAAAGVTGEGDLHGWLHQGTTCAAAINPCYPLHQWSIAASRCCRDRRTSGGRTVAIIHHSAMQPGRLFAAIDLLCCVCCTQVVAGQRRSRHC